VQVQGVQTCLKQRVHVCRNLAARACC
jgi:hypothetical protein